MDSTYGDSLHAADLVDVVGASLVRTVCVAAGGGFVLGFFPGVLLLAVLEFNMSFFSTLAARFECWASPAAQVLQLVALVALLGWRFCDATPLAQARAQLMCVESAVHGDEARDEAVKEVMVAVGWSHFVQGLLACWVLISVLTLWRILALLTVGGMWLALDAWDLAPFGVEVALARLMLNAADASESVGDKSNSASTYKAQSKKTQ